MTGWAGGASGRPALMVDGAVAFGVADDDAESDGEGLAVAVVSCGDGEADGLAEAAALVQPAAPPMVLAGSAGGAPVVPSTVCSTVPRLPSAVPRTGAGSPASFGQVGSALGAVRAEVVCGLLAGPLLLGPLVVAGSAPWVVVAEPLLPSDEADPSVDNEWCDPLEP